MTNFALTKSFSTSKMMCYFDGDPMQYIASIKFPPIASPNEEYDNTSMSGPIKVADAFRRGTTGDGELKAEATSAGMLAKVLDPTLVQTMKLSTIVNTLQPQMGRFLPMPVLFSVACQFFEYDPGSIKAGDKRDLTAKFNMFSWKIDIAGITVIDFDFVNSSFEINDVDLLTAVMAVL